MNGIIAACTSCGSHTYVTPLHDEKGGPLMCPLCAGQWHAKHGRQRRAGRIVVKAIKAFYEAGGKSWDIRKLKDAAFGIGAYADGDTIGAELGDITTELLADTLQLTHPDKHPPERQELATRVTQELLALKPFVFPKPVPPPAQPPTPRDASVNVPGRNFEEALQATRSYPCFDCADTVPYYYCSTCKAEWEKRRKDKRDSQNARQRKWYARRKRSGRWTERSCPECKRPIGERRSDTKYCSPACRQKAHRKRKGARA
jgi:hypothetical protein